MSKGLGFGSACGTHRVLAPEGLPSDSAWMLRASFCSSPARRGLGSSLTDVRATSDLPVGLTEANTTEVVSVMASPVPSTLESQCLPALGEKESLVA